ncbi:MAG: hypothetical protein R3F44_05265 [Candidatus Competibacteraceae bacterium]
MATSTVEMATPPRFGDYHGDDDGVYQVHYRGHHSYYGRHGYHGHHGYYGWPGGYYRGHRRYYPHGDYRDFHGDYGPPRVGLSTAGNGAARSTATPATASAPVVSSAASTILMAL